MPSITWSASPPPTPPAYSGGRRGTRRRPRALYFFFSFLGFFFSFRIPIPLAMDSPPLERAMRAVLSGL